MTTVVDMRVLPDRSTSASRTDQGSLRSSGHRSRTAPPPLNSCQRRMIVSTYFGSRSIRCPAVLFSIGDQGRTGARFRAPCSSTNRPLDERHRIYRGCQPLGTGLPKSQRSPWARPQRRETAQSGPVCWSWWFGQFARNHRKCGVGGRTAPRTTASYGSYVGQGSGGPEQGLGASFLAMASSKSSPSGRH
jgi:hypothetical protein